MTADGAMTTDGPVTADGPVREQQRPLRSVLGRFATGVAVVTAVRRGRPAGLTVNSFTSLSLDPPLVLWCLNRASTHRAAFTAAPHFAVHLLGADQRELAIRFAGPGDRFDRLSTRPGPHGVPLLDGTIGTLICRRDRIVPAGDHLVLIGEVLDHHAEPGAPLLFLDGRFHRGPAPETT
ncbi:flavin reductase family protein [Streptomyces sp. SPB162]|uniref:flavin reductase family protein n=1 Tax=Streptomyces sp. SPB162 TaxID=2940560 RepID=UPI0024058088|nr:flavin reductase family protein [Streptomyces sp. SPB162]MDF9816912.1 flavin reductase (DIM6/NTAB) family NADH-FMN oxidoreductase RutF [Streptomyces sp. SPB162]